MRTSRAAGNADNILKEDPRDFGRVKNAVRPARMTKAIKLAVETGEWRHTIISFVADSASSGKSRSIRSMSHWRRVRKTTSPS